MNNNYQGKISNQYMIDIYVNVGLQIEPKFVTGTRASVRHVI